MSTDGEVGEGDSPPAAILGATGADVAGFVDDEVILELFCSGNPVDRYEAANSMRDVVVTSPPLTWMISLNQDHYGCHYQSNNT
jgi:hypothetical protein